jgi:hypothetical protein
LISNEHFKDFLVVLPEGSLGWGVRCEEETAIMDELRVNTELLKAALLLQPACEVRRVSSEGIELAREDGRHWQLLHDLVTHFAGIEVRIVQLGLVVNTTHLVTSYLQA